MNHLPGYDAWLTHDPRDRDYGPCETCGHPEDDHGAMDTFDSFPCLVDGCECQEFIEGDPRERS